MKVIRIFAVAAALVAAAACTEKQDPQPEPTTSVNVTIMSFNIRTSTMKDEGDRSWDTRKTAIQKMVNDIQPDVMGMQEATTAQRKDLKALLPDYELLEVPGTGTSKGGNTIIMYKTANLDLVRYQSFYLSSTPDKPSVNGWNEETQYRTTIWAEFQHKTGKQHFFVADTHMPLGSETRDITARTNSANLNVNRMKDKAGDTGILFIIGDMNCSKADAGLQPYYDWMSAARETALRTDSVLSFNNWGGSGKSNLDHIFVRNAVVSEFKTINNSGYGVAYISDHYPVIAKTTLL